MLFGLYFSIICLYFLARDVSQKNSLKPIIPSAGHLFGGKYFMPGDFGCSSNCNYSLNVKKVSSFNFFLGKPLGDDSLLGDISFLVEGVC